MWYALHVRSKRGSREMSMKRYTNRLDDGQAIMNCQDCDTDWTNKHAPKCTVMYCRNRLKDRVAAYEDTGLEPQEIEKIRQDVEAGFLKQTARRYGIDVDRIRELVEADRKGRFVKDNGKWTLRKCLTNGIDTERLMEICNAEQEGRCLVLPPLKIGDTAYFLLQNDIYAATVFLIQWERRKGCEDNGIIWADGVLGTKSANMKDFGKTVFSNYFAANDALKRGLKDGM